ncbi:MAG TPA: MFS transporter [Phycisphaerales bacterium]|nr:MFS transporter [Phycisphaerales bacterium]
MTTVATETPSVTPSLPVRAVPLAATAGSHAVIDFFSALIIPIMSVLEGRLEMTHAQGALILAVGSLCSGFVQPLVAWLSDRLDQRMLGPISFAVAVIATSLVGRVQSYEQLMLVQIVGTLGIGAFHPVAAAAMGRLSGRRRSLGVSVFFCAGIAGGVAGHLSSPLIAGRLGMGAYLWLMIPGLLACLALAWAVRRVSHRPQDADALWAAWPAGESAARWRAVWVLYFGNVLRFTVNMMLIQLFIRWSEHAALSRDPGAVLDEAGREAASLINGPIQAAMQVGMAVGGLSAGAFLRRHHEKGALIAVPAAGALAVAAFPFAGGVWAPYALSLATGVGFAGVVPVTIALAQRLLPHRTGLASGLMMGGAWGFAGVGPPLAQWIDLRWGLSTAFIAAAALLFVAGLLSTALPAKLLARISPH